MKHNIGHALGVIVLTLVSGAAMASVAVGRSSIERPMRPYL